MAFVLTCAVPTAATLAWIAHWHRPWRVSDAQAALGAELRADVLLADWHAPRPDLLRTSRFALAERGTTAGLLEAVGVEVHQLSDRQSIAVERVTIDAQRVRAAIEQAALWIAKADQPVELRAEELVLQDSVRGLETAIYDVQLRTVMGEGGVWTVQLLGSLTRNDGEIEGDGGAQNRIRILVEQLTQESQSIVRTTIESSDAAMPAWLLQAAAPMLGNLGAEATFTGAIQLTSTIGELSGAARGQLHGVSLASVLPAGSPLRAEGSAHVTLTDLRWRGRQVERLVGSVRAEGCRVNYGLLEATTKHLFCGRVDLGPSTPADAQSDVPIDALACRFEFDRQGLTLWGNFPAEANLPPGCLATSQGRPLLMQPHVLLPAGYWVQFVAGPSTNWMPATQESVDTAGRLPLPGAATVKQ